MTLEYYAYDSRLIVFAMLFIYKFRIPMTLVFTMLFIYKFSMANDSSIYHALYL